MDGAPFTPDEQFLITEIQKMIVPQAILFSDIAFSNPLQYEYCSGFLTACWLRIFAEAEEHEGLAAAFRFILSPRTDAQMASLIDEMSKCRCTAPPDDIIGSQFMETFHDDAREAREARADESISDMEELMKIVIFRIVIVLHKTNATVLAKHKSRQKWPVSVDDVFLPDIGAETVVRSIEQWMQHVCLLDPWPIELLGSIARLCRFMVTPAMVHSQTLFPTIVRTVQRICDEASSHIGPKFSVPELARTCERLVQHMRRISSFLNDFFHRSGAIAGVLDDMPVAHKDALVHICDRAAKLLKSPLVVRHGEGEFRIDSVLTFTSIVTLLYDDDVSPDGLDPRLIENAYEKADIIVNGPPLKTIPLLLVAWKQSLRCYAKSCPESLQSSHTFKRCSACGVVSYCGKECQKRAWGDHKKICKIIAKIIHDGGDVDDRAKFTRNCEAGMVDADDAEVVIASFSYWRSTHGNVSV
ncbi:hypothetical protein C8J57DRAFT_242315 [Mycena rebaudengoi]|nr:hypothetical protein C8J57DRAFT_242315 [Mycena rebaudengoi]